jgi:hypothetical protein
MHNRAVAVVLESGIKSQRDLIKVSTFVFSFAVCEMKYLQKNHSLKVFVMETK